ncbi:MAG TPA: CHAP domain-containing protein [Ktedonobacterales bacterium]|nr:CHAP domain-containing protein [Ktedonobacterales bacterium]
MPRREGTVGEDPRPHATRVVPAVELTQMRPRITTPPRTLGETAARVAVVAPADSRSRHTTAARRLRRSDTALVTATTQLLAVVEPEETAEQTAEQRALVPLAPERALDLASDGAGDRDLDREPVTIITATLPAAHSPLVRLGAPPPHRHPRARYARLAVVSVALAACLLIAVRFALPLTGERTEPGSYTSHLPTLSDDRAVPTGPWSTGAGVSQTLGLGGGAAPGVKAPGSAGAPVSQSQQSGSTQSGGTPTPASSGSSGVQPAPVHPWPPSNPYMYVPGHPSFGMTDVNGYYYWAFGQCTWWAQYKKQNENLTRMGSAMYWAAGAASRGYRTGSVPAAGATVVFQPGVQGAGGYGHVAHVEAVYPGGWFLMSEMNFYVNGGGWGRVDYRYAHAGWGVSFIY